MGVIGENKQGSASRARYDQPRTIVAVVVVMAGKMIASDIPVRLR